MKRLLLIITVCSSAGCILWPNEDAITQLRCDAAPDDPGCSTDAGPRDAGAGDAGSGDAGAGDAGPGDAGDAGSVDAGTIDAGEADAGADGGADAGEVDAGPWRLAWRALYDGGAIFLVGDDAGATLITRSPIGETLIGVGASGPSGAAGVNFGFAPLTAAYERDRTLVAALPSQQIQVWTHTQSYDEVVTRNAPGFSSTAIDLYPLAGGGLAVAAFGNLDGGIAVDSFGANVTQTPDFFVTVAPCTTTTLKPLRILPTPDGGPGVVVGNVNGACSQYFVQINAVGGGGFVAHFGGSVPNAGYSFSADVNSPMALGIVQNDLWVVYQSPQASTLQLAHVLPDPPLVGIPLLSGRLTPVELIGVGNDAVLVGFVTGGIISLPDGGPLTPVHSGDDVFVARFNVQGQLLDLQVFAAPGDQDVVGAVMIDGRLIVAGNCRNPASGLCRDAGVDQSWLAGFDFVQP